MIKRCGYKVENEERDTEIQFIFNICGSVHHAL